MNIDAFLAPVTPEQPCGENLEYDSDFQAMEQAMQGKAEQQFGDTIIPAEPADWATVERLAVSLLSRTKDLRVMLALTQAWTMRSGLTGYASGLLLVQQGLSIYWESIYPLLEEFGEIDPFYRMNALAVLSDKSRLTTVLHKAVLLHSNRDDLMVCDAQALLDGSKTECADYLGGRSRLIEELAYGGQPGIDAILVIHLRLQTIQDILSDRLGESYVLEMEQWQKTVGLIASACQVTDISMPSEESAVSEHEVLHGTASPSIVDWRSAQIVSRAEAKKMLEKVKQYFTQYEPSHPAPLMIERVQRLIGLDFIQIIKELNPDSAHQLENIFGRSD
ncbi:type VI secretion system protein TssA [Serratia sp. N21D137]|uniref:type VI secretion system protein TssA n=1 Tax=Serratia sp. N21D137 TaxID=3397495 RepID=UPI0039E069A2